MGLRQFQFRAVTPAEAERSPAHWVGVPEPQVTRSTGQQDLRTGGIAAPGRIADPRARAQALARASGGRLDRAGAALLQLQRSYGNRYVQQVINSARQMTDPPAAPALQAKLVVGPADDGYEREADRVAGQVRRLPAARRQQREDQGISGVRARPQHPCARAFDVTDDIQQAMPAVRAPGRSLSASLKEEFEAAFGADFGAVVHTEQAPDVQPLAGAEGAAAVVEPAVQQAVQSAHGGGTPLPESTREQMEQALRADFGGVSVHTDARADALNRQLGARAFTSGQDIFFRRGEYSPSTPAGRHTLAHELTHVVQQQPNAHHSAGGTIQRMVQQHGNVEFENTNPRQRPTRTMQALTEGTGVKLETHTLYLEDKVVARGPDTDLAGWHLGYTQTMYNAARNFYYQRPGGRITRTTETANGLPLLDTSDLGSPFYSLQSMFRSPRNNQKWNMSMTDTPYTRYLPKADLIRTDGRDDFRAWLVAIHQPTGRVLFLHHVDWHVDWSAMVDENGELVPSSHSGTTVDAAGDGRGTGRQPILTGTRTLQAVALTPETVVNPMTMAFREKMSSDAAKFPKKSLKKAIKIIEEARSKISTRRLEGEPLLGQARATLDRHLASLAKMAELVGGGHIVPDDFHETVGLTDTAVEEAKAALHEAQIQMLRHGASREVVGAPGQALAELEKWHRKADRS